MWKLTAWSIRMVPNIRRRSTQLRDNQNRRAKSRRLLKPQEPAGQKKVSMLLEPLLVHHIQFALVLLQS